METLIRNERWMGALGENLWVTDSKGVLVHSTSSAMQAFWIDERN